MIHTNYIKKVVLTLPFSILSSQNSINPSSTALTSIPIQEMCQGIDTIKVEVIDDITPNKLNNNDNNLEKISKHSALFPMSIISNIGTRMKNIIPIISGGLVQGPYTKKKIAILIILSSLVLGVLTFTSLYQFHTGFRRTVQFWHGMGPIAMEYKLLKVKAKRWDKLSEDDDEYKKRLSAYREVAAPKLVNLILKLGGIYIKIGQVLSTMGAGILPEEYIQALRPLQDGVPPRDIKDIRHIIESSSNKKMSDMFEEFDEKPIGAASIAQAHRARLRPINNNSDIGEEVVVKVQYPEIAEMLEADLRNMELVTKWFAPENLELAKGLRKRHENELDFRIEANNIRECTTNMQSYGVEPTLVRIPRVRNETGLCNKNVLVMEYLDGTSLNDVIAMEQDRMARAMGKEDAQELRRALSQRMRDHFEQGGGEEQANVGDGTLKHMFDVKSKVMKVVSPNALASAFRFYVQVKTKVDGVLSSLRLKPQQQQISKEKNHKHFNLKSILSTLVHVHGLQILKDGVYNADPHPGNVLVLPDGRLGLLDYGMVGRLSNDERYSIANTILGLHNQNKTQVANLYTSSGYAATMSNENVTDINILHRFATFHLDKIDLSPLILENGEVIEIMNLMKNARERVIPPWVEEGRRLGGLLQGVCAQAARPISLAKEWNGIASQVVQTSK